MDQPLTPPVCTAEEIKKAFPNVRDPLEAAVAYAFKLLGFNVKTNVSMQNRAGYSIEVDVVAEKKKEGEKESLVVYASCKNKEIDRPVVDEEYGRVSNLKKIPHLKVLVASSMTPQAKETAESDGFLVIELGMKVTEDKIAEACREIRNRLGKYFETLAPPELVSAYSALQGALSTLRNVEKEIEKAIESLQKVGNIQGSLSSGSKEEMTTLTLITTPIPTEVEEHVEEKAKKEELLKTLSRMGDIYLIFNTPDQLSNYLQKFNVEQALMFVHDDLIIILRLCPISDLIAGKSRVIVYDNPNAIPALLNSVKIWVSTAKDPFIGVIKLGKIIGGAFEIDPNTKSIMNVLNPAVELTKYSIEGDLLLIAKLPGLNDCVFWFDDYLSFLIVKDCNVAGEPGRSYRLTKSGIVEFQRRV